MNFLNKVKAYLFDPAFLVASVAVGFLVILVIYPAYIDWKAKQADATS